MASGLEVFHEHLREVSRLSAWAMPTGGLVPILVSFTDLNPPWPNRTGLAAGTCVAVLFTLIAVFQLLNAKSKRTVNRVVAWTLAIGTCLAVIYLALFAAFVFQPKGGEPFVKGYECTNDALQLYASKCPWLDVDELRAAAYEETRLWTSWSVFVVRFALALTWFISFVSFAACMGAFVRHQSRLRN